MKIFAIIIILIGIYIIYVYNKALKWDLKVDNSWSQISIQIKAKISTIPNLLEIAVKYAEYEKDLFSTITKDRVKLINSESANENISSNSELNRNVEKLFAVAENYPDLKANETFIELQKQIRVSEGKIAIYRQFYNDTVMLYNRFIQTFPHNLIVKLFGYKEKEFLKFDIED
ncbi:LemA family protein [Sedimentibacter sp. zth1]|uniref:LemA family protein n=1 Tax=Sedimentibacter sp. zth1 TaxID=2816908 RepID=UPI001A90DF18|nr:LemA family protein [Sedimentibacter sp. zth1]QSX05847.1 LemA family protein [Sedimentibacter sp. zth1]